MTVIDFNAAMAAAKRAGSFEPLPDGEYDMVCLEATPTTTSTNKPMIKAKFQVETGPHAGSKAWDQYVFSADNDNALSFFFQHMRHFGLDETFFSANPTFEQVAQTLPGRRCRMQLGQRMWEGRPRNEVLRIMPPSSPNPTAAAGYAAGGVVPGAPAAVPSNVVPFPPAAAPAAAPQVPQVPVAAPVAAPQPVAPPVAPQPVQGPVAAPPPVPPAQPVPVAPPVPQPQVAPPPAAAPPPPPQPVWDGTQWVLPQPATPTQVPTTPEEPF